MITLQQVQELRNRVDNLRLALIELREENAMLKDDACSNSKRIAELEAQLRSQREAESGVQSELASLLQALDRDLDQTAPAENLEEYNQALQLDYLPSGN